MNHEPNNGNGVRITNREIYEKVETLTELVRPLADIPKRVRNLELRTYAIIAGLLAGIITLIGGPKLW